MKKLLRFFNEVSKLKEAKRRKWLANQIPNPETTASHIFRLAIMAWILGKKKKLSRKRLIKLALVHDLPEVYTFDFTPYDPLLPRNLSKYEKVKPVLEKWPQLYLSQKRKKTKAKWREEYTGMKKLTSYLSPALGKEMMELWLEFKRGLTKEARFVWQLDKLETFLQAMEYWEKYKKINLKVWTRWIKECLDDSLLLEFEGIIESKFLKKKPVSGNSLSSSLNFFVKIGELKSMVRKGWILRGITQGSTVSEDSFLLAVAVWVLGSKKKELDLEKMLKMSLSFELCKVYTKDRTPYENILPKRKVQRDAVLGKWPKFTEEEKEKRFLEDYAAEERALKKLLFGISSGDKMLIINLWDECKRKLSKEGRFVSQVYWLMLFFQAFNYWVLDSAFPILAWWQQMERFIAEPLCKTLLDVLADEFEILKFRPTFKKRFSFFFRRVVFENFRKLV